MLPDLDKLFESLSQSRFRRRFQLNPQDAEYLRKRGLAVVLEHGKEFIADRLAPAVPARDGKQTPWRGHPVFVAQHATATCCRSCLAKWHDIEKGRELTDSERNHVLKTIERWLEEQRSPAQGSATCEIVNTKSKADETGKLNQLKLFADTDE